MHQLIVGVVSDHMIRTIKSFRLWVKTLRHYEKGDYEDAIASYEKFAETWPESLNHRAFYASLLMLNHDGTSSLSQFDRIIQDIEKIDDFEMSDRLKYIWAYCKMTTCGLRGSEDRQKYYELAMKTRVRQSLKKLLPVSPS